ncbi:hypothetical protein BLNAU_19313 [Blattamonas nauphoetae]|uniref:Uncharacterized protein n=1 Tax=Blattamonas nauphoetae TaxID=2049346 RepID=A0ABQ9X237_9EUKA|nr:hypothetical protein BLNAU_19313 [Blattamonas nauphoetae]
MPKNTHLDSIAEYIYLACNHSSRSNLATSFVILRSFGRNEAMIVNSQHQSSTIMTHLSLVLFADSNASERDGPVELLRKEVTADVVAEGEDFGKGRTQVKDEGVGEG